jgi:non-specific serine/threonine protein kinase
LLRDAGDLLGALEEYRRLEQRLLREFGSDVSASMRRFATQLRSELAELKLRGGTLPLPMTTFIGRRTESARAIAALRERRHVALIGPAGVGKSRIAIRTARRAQHEFNSDITYISLEGVAPDEFEAHLATAFAIANSSASPMQTVLDVLAEREMLLVLDGCEGVAASAGAFIAAALERSRTTRIVSTSRHRFDAPGEMLAIAPFGVPESATISLVGDETAIDFFVDRAANVLPSFTLDETSAPLVADICRRLDGLPLALELAASRLSLMSLEQLHRRLVDRFTLLTRIAGHNYERSLLETLRFSYDLLDEAQRACFIRLGVFRDGWTLDAAEAICSGDELAAGRVLEALGALRDRSLAMTSEVSGTIRYRLLNTLHDFAEDELRARPVEDRAARSRHARFYGALLAHNAEAIAKLEPPALALVDAEFSNLIAALNWSFGAEGEPRVGLEMLAALRRYVMLRGLSALMLPLALELLDAVSPADRETLWYAWAMRATGTFATICEDPRGYDLHSGAVEIFRTHGDEVTVAQGLTSLASAAYRLGVYAQCETLFAEALEIFDRSGNRAWQFLTRKNSGSLMSALGRFDEAQRFFEGADEVSDAANPFDVENLINNRSNLAYLMGDYGKGVAFAREAIAKSRQMRQATVEGLDLLALNQFAGGDRGAAWRTFREAFAETRGYEVPQSVAQVFEDAVVCGSQAGFDPNPLAEALGHSRALRERHRNPVNPSFLPHLERVSAALREKLGPAAFARALERGATMRREDVLEKLDALAAVAETPETLPGLTERESEIARLVAAGKRSSEIAQQLFVSVRTVDNHLAAIYRKLGVKSRAHVVAFVMENA